MAWGIKKRLRPADIWRKALTWARGRHPHLRLSFRVTIAGVLAYALATGLKLPQGYWAVFTAVIVTQGSIGGSIKAIIERFIGTFGGAVYGAVVGLLIPPSNAVAVGAELALALGPLVFLAARKPSFRVAPLTAMILLLGVNDIGPLQSAVDRVIEIVVGSVVGIGVSFIVLPSRAHGQFLDECARTLDLLTRLLIFSLSGAARPRSENDLQRFYARLRPCFTKLEALASDMQSERTSHLSDAPDSDPMLRTLRRMRNDIVMIGRATEEPFTDEARVQLGDKIITLSDASGEFLDGARHAMLEGLPAPSLDGVTRGADDYAVTMASLLREYVGWGLNDHAIERMYALHFGFVQLQDHLRDLAARVDELASYREAARSKPSASR